jgi:predicted enzyme related to lactoylglutathione lyase
LVHENEFHDHDEHNHDHDHDHEIGPRHFFGVLPVFLVDDIVATVEFYRDVLGFEVDFLYGTPPAYASVSRDDAIFNFSMSDPPGRRNSVSAAGFGNGVDAYIVVSDVDDLYEELKEHGAKIVAELASHEYGMREFQIEDCNQYRIALAEETDDV